MRLTKEKIKALCDEMPYFGVCYTWTGELANYYDYTYSYLDCIPVGWHKMFIQMCEDIREPLEKAGLLDKFYFTQVKEKYGSLRAYNSGATDEVHRIIMKYEYLSQFVCQNCGKPATKETVGWIAEYCDNCFKDGLEFNEIEFNPIMKLHTFGNGENKTIEIDCSDEWSRLYESANT